MMVLMLIFLCCAVSASAVDKSSFVVETCQTSALPSGSWSCDQDHTKLVTVPSGTSCQSDCSTTTQEITKVSCRSNIWLQERRTCASNPDTEPPVFTVPDHISATSDAGKTTAVVTFTEPTTATDNVDGTVTVERPGDYGSGSEFPEGSTFIHFYARDAAGNTLALSLMVHVHVHRCPKLERLSNGYILCNPNTGTVDGTRCEFGCYPGYNLVGANETYCSSNDQWTAAQPSCETLTCPKLHEPSTPAQWSEYKLSCSDESNYLSRCEFSCHLPRFDLPRTTRRVTICQADGRWNGETNPVCVDILPPFMGYNKYAEFIIGKNEDKANIRLDVTAKDLEDGAVLPYLVSGPKDGDQVPVGTYTAVYSAIDRAGNEAPPIKIIVVVKEIRCSNVYPTPYTTVECTGTLWGRSCRFECKEGTGMNGTNTGHCMKAGNRNYGTWSWGKEQPICEVVQLCAAPDPPTRGAFACDAWLGGRYCQMQCQKGYDISPRAIFPVLTVCDNTGSWTHESLSIPLPKECMSYGRTSSTSRKVYFFYDGDCHDDAVRVQIKENFIKALQASTFNHICKPADGCTWQHVDVYCGSTRKKRDTTSEANTIINLQKRSASGDSVQVDVDVTIENTGDVDEDTFLNNTNTLNELSDSLATDALNNTFNLDLGNNVTLGVNQISSAPVELVCTNNTVPSYYEFVCVECPSGSFLNAAKKQCDICPRGSYQPNANQSSCISCPLHTSTADTGSKSASDCHAACSPGSYSKTSLPVCTPCEVGFYQESYGALFCKQCPGAKITETESATSISQCQEFDVAFPGNQTEPAELPFVDNNEVGEAFILMRAQCESVNCSGELATIPLASGNNLTLGFGTFIYVDVDNVITTTETQAPDDARWHSYLIHVKSNELSVFLDSALIKSVPLASNSTLNNNGSVFLGGDGFEGKISQFNVFSASSSLDDMKEFVNKCSNVKVGDVISWTNFTQAKLNDAFFQLPSLCDHINECESSPCQNGTCNDELNAFTCSCTSGYEGALCETNIDDCVSNSCQNGATCEDQTNNYTCTCPPLFTGPYCEIPMVDGGWTAWTDFSLCSVTCGNGTKTRKRECNNPAPNNGGAECIGIANETSTCFPRHCPECQTLTAPENAELNCTGNSNFTSCSLKCKDGYDFDQQPSGNFECGKDSYYIWNFMNRANKIGVIPYTCSEIKRADTMKIARTVFYKGMDCSAISALHSPRSKIEEKVEYAVGNLTCIKNGTCLKSGHTIDRCTSGTSRKKRDTSSAGYTISLQCDAVNWGSDACDAALVQAMVELQVLEQGSSLHLDIDGITYVVSYNDSITNLDVVCPSGTVKVFSYCVPCGTGRYESNDICELCPVGFYQDEKQQETCKQCPTGTSTAGKGSRNASHCDIYDLIIDISEVPAAKETLRSVLIGVICAIVVLVVAIVAFVVKRKYFRTGRMQVDSIPPPIHVEKNARIKYDPSIMEKKRYFNHNVRLVWFSGGEDTTSTHDSRPSSAKSTTSINVKTAY